MPTLITGAFGARGGVPKEHDHRDRRRHLCDPADPRLPGPAALVAPAARREQGLRHRRQGRGQGARPARASWLRKPFTSSNKAANKSASTGRRGPRQDADVAGAAPPRIRHADDGALLRGAPRVVEHRARPSPPSDLPAPGARARRVRRARRLRARPRARCARSCRARCSSPPARRRLRARHRHGRGDLRAQGERRAPARLGREAVHDGDGAAALRPRGHAAHARARHRRARRRGRVARRPLPAGRRRPAAEPRRASPTLASTFRRHAPASAAWPARSRRRVAVRPAARRRAHRLRGRLRHGAACSARSPCRAATAATARPPRRRRGGWPVGCASAASRSTGRTGDRPPRRQEAQEIAAVESPPVAQLAGAINVPSDNFASEMLLKAMGAQLRRRAARPRPAPRVVRETLLALRHPPADRRRLGAVAGRPHDAAPGRAAASSAWTASRRARPSRPRWRVIGRTGTVRRRMRGTAAQDRCRAKTGTLRAVSALAGVCTTTGGRRVAFALLMSTPNILRAHGAFRTA